MQIITQNQLRHYTMRHPEESATIEAVEHFLIHADRAKCRDKISGSAWIFNPNSGKILIAQDTNTNKWSALSRSINRQSTDSIQKIVSKELSMTLGLTDLSLTSDNIFSISISYSAQAKVPYYQHNFCFLYSTTENQIQSNIQGIKQIEWTSVAEILQKKPYQSIQPLVKKWQLVCENASTHTQKT